VARNRRRSGGRQASDTELELWSSRRGDLAAILGGTVEVRRVRATEACLSSGEENDGGMA
jgi:hypothetical protein